MTGRDVVSASLRLIGALASGETPEAGEATDGLSALNRMLDSWSNDGLLVYSKVREVFGLIASQKTYTMGSGGDFNTTRPLRIENALFQITSVTPNVELPLETYTKDEYAAIPIKDLSSTYPLAIYEDTSFPLTNVTVWPVPSAAINLVLYSWKALSSVATLDTVLSFPPGYEEAIIYNLAVRFSPEYGRAISDDVRMIASDSKSAIKRMNTVPHYLAVDDALRARPGVWNWRTGGLK